MMKNPQSSFGPATRAIEEGLIFEGASETLP
jgi:hypothetical protein